MADNKNINLYTQANRKAWDASADHHRLSTEWQKLIGGFQQPGFSTFDPTMTGLMQQVEIEGKRLVQVGCNNGREIASAVSLGAKFALGIDQSAQFLEQAAELKGLVDSWADGRCQFVCSDIHKLPQTIPTGFELCFISIGVLNWMPDLSKFFSHVVSLLAPGGKLLVYETHPILEVFEPASESPYLPAYSYFAKEPYVSTEAITYDGTKSEGAAPSYWFSHTLAEIINSCIDADLSIMELQEYPHSNREVDFDIYQNQAGQVPLCFSLIAVKNG